MATDVMNSIGRCRRIIGLVLTLLFTVFACGAQDDRSSSTKVKRIGIEEFEKLRSNTNAVVLDVRSAAEVKNGSIPGSLNIDINSSKFGEIVDALDKGKMYLVYCAVGMRSARACKRMETLGFKQLYDLAPGYDGWKKKRNL